MQVVFSKMLDVFEWLSLEACIVGIGLLSFSSIGFIVVLCLLKKTRTKTCSQFENYQVITLDTRNTLPEIQLCPEE